MNTLISPLLLLPSQNTRSSPHLQRNHTLHPKPPTYNANHSYFTKKSWKLHAEAKGFGPTAVTVSEKKRRNNENASNRSNNDNNNNDDDKIPQVVWDRMIVRILSYVGTPMAIGIALLYILSALKDQQIWDVPVWLPFVTTLLSFGTSALGIAYGTLSTSLDAEKKGTVLGWEEVQKNWPELWRDEDESKR